MSAKAKKEPETWLNRIVEHAEVAPKDLVAHPYNARTHPTPQEAALVGSINDVGFYRSVTVNKRTGHILDGHLRVELAIKQGQKTIPVEYVDIPEELEAEVLLTADPLAALAEYNKESLDHLLREIQTGEPALQQMLAELAAESGLSYGAQESPQAPEPEIDRAAELLEKWQVKLGQLWECGRHKILCGDSTSPADVARVMNNEKAVLCHADPPYGMGKENDGVANDNLYAAKLDAFQMAWWKVARRYLEDNASAYIWGNAEDLWRLWYVGGLNASERLTYRNELVWEQEGTSWGKSGMDGLRQYATNGERCLFFMLGEQGFNNNADNYWEGWEPLRSYLDGERQKMGWTMQEPRSIAGHAVPNVNHWMGKAQWEFPTTAVYRSWQAAANGKAFTREHDAFSREYDELKREHNKLKADFYATRAFFEKPEGNQTSDIWRCDRVKGPERGDHPTPKPVEMIERIMKSSAPKDAVVYAPFLGSGTDLVAAERTGRQARAVELEPKWVAVSLERMLTLTGKTPLLADRVTYTVHSTNA